MRPPASTAVTVRLSDAPAAGVVVAGTIVSAVATPKMSMLAAGLPGFESALLRTVKALAA